MAIILRLLCAVNYMFADIIFQDLSQAKRIIIHMYKNKTVSLVFPAYNEEDNIATAVKDFLSLKIIDEIIVVDNNSRDTTAQKAKQAGARVVKETKQGYGFALIKGLSSAKSDIVVLAEPDGTFAADDLLRLLKLSAKYDCVVGTRTNPRYIQKGANMKMFLRLGNIALAKIMQYLYGMPSISDCGCTFRVFNRGVVKTILPHLTIGTSHFLPQTILLTHLFGFTIFELPVQYRARVGESKITGSLKKSIYVGLNMLGIILYYWSKRNTFQGLPRQRNS